MEYKALSKHFGIEEEMIFRARENHHGMGVWAIGGALYAVGAPGFTENYYGPEERISDHISAYRLSVEQI